MSPNVTYTILLAGAYLVLFAFAELLYHKFNVKAETTRKIVHIVTGIFTLFFPILVQNKWLVLALCTSFLLILLISFPLKLLPSINAVNRKTVGSILYPIIVFSCYLIYDWNDNLAMYYIPILILALSDPTAAFIGKKFPWRRYTSFGQQKTVSGSAGFFMMTFLLSLMLLTGVEHYSIKAAVIIGGVLGLITTLAEGIAHGGYDNLTIPSSAVLTLLYFEHFTAFHV